MCHQAPGYGPFMSFKIFAYLFSSNKPLITFGRLGRRMAHYILVVETYYIHNGNMTILPLVKY